MLVAVAVTVGRVNYGLWAWRAMQQEVGAWVRGGEAEGQGGKSGLMQVP